MKCCIFSCRSNYEGTTEYVPVFSFPDKDKEPDLSRGDGQCLSTE